MLSELFPKRSAGQEVGVDATSSQPAKVPRVREETEQPEERSDPKVHEEWIEDEREASQSHSVLSDEPESGVTASDLDGDALRQLDAIADEYEVQRLIRKEFSEDLV